MNKAFFIAILVVSIVGGRLEAQGNDEVSDEAKVQVLIEQMEQQPKAEDLSHCIELKGKFTPKEGYNRIGKLYLEFLNKCSQSVFVSYCLQTGLSFDCKWRGIHPGQRLRFIYPETDRAETINRVMWEACQYKKNGYLTYLLSSASLYPSDFFRADGPCIIDKRADGGFKYMNHHYFPVLSVGASLQPGAEVPFEER